MNIQQINKNGVSIAYVTNNETLISDVQSALDLMATVRYELDSNLIIVNKSEVSEAFFDLKTRLAGEVLQKFINYQTKIAIIGDYSGYTSKSLKDFIYESSNGNDIFFVQDVEQAIEKLSSLKA
ncbi:DUF4180 domain-containing protein [Paenibacillus cucumis (ex Kampfer et al. 2016)]|uniref:DUF4180 domain-containing protein n=1 Tax=Paenibacillus cucumis (ex Kampfer et al. 2016) TaxID=1776858 RepID=A0ABS7KGK9_9BACL|nr:DUF4180 domain-containing protein [Paenibacillus cucumis (ex Kampfer et al. 2016)]MBY0203267.1 DUF4180 domain-containing protein [Paenibacillus cucumis (ex Kampfer et al. 2016)]